MRRGERRRRGSERGGESVERVTRVLGQPAAIYDSQASHVGGGGMSAPLLEFSSSS